MSGPTLEPGTQVEAAPVDDFDVASKAYADSGAIGHEAEFDTGGGTGPSLTVRAGLRAAFVYWSDLDVVVSGHGYYQVQMATDSGFTGFIVDDVKTKSTWATFDGLDTTTTYWFRVRAVDAAGTASDWTGTAGTTSPDQAITDDLADDSVTAIKIAALTANDVVVGASPTDATGIIRSANYSAGSAGWQIVGNGDAEFNNVTVRGEIIATSGEISGDLDVGGILTMDASGKIRTLEPTAGPSARIELSANNENTIDLYGDEYNLLNVFVGTALEIQIGVEEYVPFPGFTYSAGTAARIYPTFASDRPFQFVNMARTGFARVFAGDLAVEMFESEGRIRANSNGSAAAAQLSGPAGQGFYFSGIGATEEVRVTVDDTQIAKFTADGFSALANDIRTTGQVFVGTGSVGTPGLTFDADDDLGIYRASADRIGFTCGGALAMIVDRNFVRFENGTAGTPSISFNDDPDTGMRRGGANVIEWSRGGGRGLYLSAGLFTGIGDGQHQLGNSSNRWGQIFSTSSTVSTSDPRTKRNIRSLPPEAALDFVRRLDPIGYRVADGGIREHHGLDAEQVGMVLADLDMDHAAYIDPSKMQVEELAHLVQVEVGGPETPTPEEISAATDKVLNAPMGLRYEEFIPDIIAAVQALADMIPGAPAAPSRPVPANRPTLR